MSVQLQLAPSAVAGIGGLIQGAWGTYYPAADGTYTIDTRDAAALLAAGFTYVSQTNDVYALPMAPGAATLGQIVASGALSNGTVSVTHQPDVMRPVNVVVGTGTVAITAGAVTVVYTANDGTVQTDSISAVVGASAAVTKGLSKGVVSISSIAVAGLVGGASPYLRLDTTAALSIPVAAGTVDFGVTREYDAGATIAVGTLTSTLGSIIPTTAPNGTVTYNFLYNYVSPTS